MAKKLKVDESNLARWETGKNQLSKDLLKFPKKVPIHSEGIQFCKTFPHSSMVGKTFWSPPLMVAVSAEMDSTVAAAKVTTQKMASAVASPDVTPYSGPMGSVAALVRMETDVVFALVAAAMGQAGRENGMTNA